MSAVSEDVRAAESPRIARVARVTGNQLDRLSPSGRSAATAFFDARWIRAWEAAFLPSQSWRGPVVAYALAGESGWLALARQPVLGLPVASLAGYYWPFRTVAVAHDDDARALARHLTDHPPFPVLRMGPISSRDAGVASLIESLTQFGWRAISHHTGDVFELDVPRTADELHAGMSASLLKNIRYCERRLQRERAPVETIRHVLGADSESVLDALESVESASWVASEGGETKFVGSANRRFWNALACGGDRPSQIVFWMLRCAGTPVAFSANLETATTVYILANTYREDWKAHSPGSLLALHVLDDACARGKQRLDWGQGDSGYKARFGATAKVELRDTMLFAPGVLGTAMLAAARRALRGWQAPSNG